VETISAKSSSLIRLILINFLCFAIGIAMAYIYQEKRINSIVYNAIVVQNNQSMDRNLKYLDNIVRNDNIELKKQVEFTLKYLREMLTKCTNDDDCWPANKVEAKKSLKELETLSKQ